MSHGEFHGLLPSFADKVAKPGLKKCLPYLGGKLDYLHFVESTTFIASCRFAICAEKSCVNSFQSRKKSWRHNFL